MTMTSKERVRNAIQNKPVDRVPAAYEAVHGTTVKLLEHYGFDDVEQLYEKFEIDIRYAFANCTLDLPERTHENGNRISTSFWGYEVEHHTFGTGSYGTNITYPLNDVETVEDVLNYNWPKTDWFDYSTVTKYCKEHSDKAIVIGHEGPFQIVTNLISMEKFFILMIEEPEVAQAILDKMVEFELDHYEKMFIAGEGLIDILRTHDDYGTQISMLFSVDMWHEFFEENTKKIVDLAHKHNAFFQQHSCGAVGNIVQSLIDCGVDSLEPLQPVVGLEPETLKEKFGGKICFHGGIDTQHILPNEDVETVKKEATKYINALHNNGGYILMASQAFETDVPVENIEAVYSVPRC